MTPGNRKSAIASDETDAGVSAAGQGRHFSLQRPRLVIGLGLIALAFILYAPVQKFTYVYFDDPDYVLHNPPVLAGLNANSIHWAFQSVSLYYWHPLTWLSHMLDVTLFGLNATGHHLTNVILHALNVLLLFQLLERGTRKLWRSALVAAMYAVHPVNLEPVIWISERKTVLSALLFFLTLAAYGWYARKPDARRYVLVLVGFASALMAKPSVVTMPFVFLLIDYWPLQRLSFSRDDKVPRKRLVLLLLEKVPFVLMAGVSSWITYMGQRNATAVMSTSEFPLHLRILNAVYSYGVYLAKILWPRKLSIFYPITSHMFSGWQVLLVALVLASVTVLAVRYRKQPYGFVSWFWFVGILVPMIGIVQVGLQARADRHLYLAMVGVLVLVVWFSAETFKRFGVPKWTYWSVGLVLVLLLTWDARIQMGYWRDNAALFTRSIEVTPEENYVAHFNLAMALSDAGRLEEALPHFQYVIQTHPRAAEAYEALANAFRQKGNFEQAIPQYRQALALATTPHLQARLHSELGLALIAAGNASEAEAELVESVRLEPSFSAGVYVNLGYLLQQDGKLDGAIENYRHAVELTPTTEAYVLLGEALERENRRKEAEAAYRNALQLTPGSSEAQHHLEQLEQRNLPPH